MIVMKKYSSFFIFSCLLLFSFFTMKYNVSAAVDINSIVLDNLDFNQYLDKNKVYKNIIESPFGTDGPQIVYASDKYAVIFDYSGTLIYDFENNIICGGIDNKVLGMSATQGDNAVFFKCNDEFVFMYNSGMGQMSEQRKKSGYLYSIAENKLSYVNDMDLESINTNSQNIEKFINNDGYMKVYKKLFENKNKNSGYSAYPRDNDIVIFEYYFNPNPKNDGSNPYLKFDLYTISNEFEFLKECNFNLPIKS